MAENFSQVGATVNLAVTGAAQNLAVTSGGQSAMSVRLANIGTQTVFVNFQTTATVANGIPLLPNTVEVFAIGPSIANISAIAGATGSTLYATTGTGS